MHTGHVIEYTVDAIFTVIHLHLKTEQPAPASICLHFSKLKYLFSYKLLCDCVHSHGSLDMNLNYLIM